MKWAILLSCLSQKGISNCTSIRVTSAIPSALLPYMDEDSEGHRNELMELES